MKLDRNQPLNRKVLRYLRQRQSKRVAALALPDSVPSPYLDQGSHPDVVTWVWDTLGAALPEDSRCLVYGTPALMQPAHGIVLAFCLGTAYCLRLTPETYPLAQQQGCASIETWSDGSQTDAGREFGPDWLFGRWLVEESQWCRATYASLNDLADHPAQGSQQANPHK
jgi:hypothetical protein